MRNEIRQNQYGEALFDGNAYRTNYDYNDVRALNNSRKALNSVSIKSSRLRDYRESLESEYGEKNI